MDAGELVPDDVTIRMLKDRLEKEDVVNGAVLDGFPRTEKQAESLDKMLEDINAKVDMALNIDVPFEEIVERIANRRSCKGCSEIYNVVFNPPKQEGICDKCGGELYQREDQKPEVVQNRLKVYSESAEELINHYKEAGVLYDAKAGDSVGKTSLDVAKEVEEYIKSNNF
jgi:adenylate kinase